jgi:E3 ubiquitin-protein ligase RNF19A
VIAGVAVSIGVPILLAYVYGVVPISLCRSGGCGVITSASGVRIAFDDEADTSNTPASSATLTAANIAMSGAAAMRSFARLNGYFLEIIGRCFHRFQSCDILFA